MTDIQREARRLFARNWTAQRLQQHLRCKYGLNRQQVYRHVQLAEKWYHGEIRPVGRPRKYADKHTLSVDMDGDLYAQAVRLGHGHPTEGIREALRRT